MIMKANASSALQMEGLIPISTQELIAQLPGQFGHGLTNAAPSPGQINAEKSVTPRREKITNGFRYASSFCLEQPC